jgi:hypothetical protein
MFVDKLREGIWEIRYDLCAEVPGKFHALPKLTLSTIFWTPAMLDLRCWLR